MKEVLMSRGASTVVSACGRAQPGETVLVIADHHTVDMAEVLAAAAHSVGADPVLMVMTPRKADGMEPPPAVAAAMKESDLFVVPVSRSITHTRAVKEAVEAGSRGLMLTHFTPEMLMGGGIDADFESLAPTARRMAEAFEESRSLRLTTDAGTDMTMNIEGRPGNALTCIVEPGQFSPLPNVESNVSPVEGSAEGHLVVDGSIPYAGIGVIASEPVSCDIRDGMIVDISGGQQAAQLRESLEGMNDPLVYNVAEIGVGLNPCCRMIGLMLEDEGVYGTVHIGIGTNITLGGNVKAACHYDLIICEPTINIDGRVVLDAGDVVV